MSSFANVTIGTAANNGSGDSLRVAFSKINLNFANIQNGTADINVAAPVRSVAGRVGNIVLSVNDIGGAASTGYVNALVTAGNVHADQSYDRFATQVFDNISANLASNISAQAATLITTSNALAPLVGFQANLTAANAAIRSLQANLGSVIISSIAPLANRVNTIDANVGTLSVGVATLTSNAGTQATSINNLGANVSTHASQIAVIQSTLNTVAANLVVLFGNTQNQESRITQVQNGIDTLVSNASVQALSINSVLSSLAQTNANVTAANTAITHYATLGQLNDNVNVINTSIYNLGLGQAAGNARISSVATDLAAFAANIVTIFEIDEAYDTSMFHVLANAVSSNVARIDANLGSATNNIIALFADYGTLAGRIESTNGNIIAANTALKAYVDRVDAFNRYTDANVELYLPTSATVTAVNLAIVTANTGMKSYVDTVTTNWQSNASTQNAEMAALRANIVAANAAIITVATGSGFVTYPDLTSNIATVRTIVTSNVAAANAVAVTANTNMKAYVDGRITAITYGNTNVATYITVDPTVSNIVSALASINSNLTVVRGNITAIYAVDSTQTTDINNLRANIIAANAAISAIVGAGSSYSNVNVAGYLTTSGIITELQANVAAANAAIVTANTRMKAYVDNQIRGNVWNGNVVITNGELTNDINQGGLVIAGSGGLSVGGNVNIGSGLYVGQGAQTTPDLQNIIGVMMGSSTTGPGSQYTQLAIMNMTDTGSTDLALYSDTGNTETGWIDVGIAGSAFNDSHYEITKPMDSYLFGAGQAGFGGNLVIATAEHGFRNDIVFATGGFLNQSEVARLHGNAAVGGAFTVNVAVKANNYQFANGASILSQVNTLRNGTGTSNVSVLSPNGVIAVGVYNAGTGTAANTFAVCSGIVHVNDRLRVDGTTTFNNDIFANSVSISANKITTTTGIFWANGNPYNTQLSAPAFISNVSVGQGLTTSPSSITQLSIVYDNVSKNIGSGYSSSTGVFTAPISGFYQVSAAIGVTPSNWANVNNYNSAGVIGLYKNGNPVASGPYIDMRGVVLPGNVILQVTTSSSVSSLVYLNANDTLNCGLAYLTTAPTNFWNTSTNVVEGYFQACWLRP